MSENRNKKGELLKKRPSAVLSLMPIAVLVIMLIATIKAFGSDALSGASQITLLTVSALCVLIGMGYLNVPWASFEKAITKNVASVSSALVILLLIGALGGTWMVSGVVPTLIYYGVQTIHPDIFLASTCAICALVSVMTGSSWTTIATIGIALMGIGRAQGFGDGWVAGAIISGAYFGDKISPLSETTTLASGSLGVPLFKHIRYMLVTTVPSMVITLILFTVAGLLYDTSGSQDIETFTRALDGRFNITPWLLLVPVLTGVLIARRTPPVITLFLSALMSVVAGLVFQEGVLSDIDPSLFKASMISLYGSTSVHTDSAMLTDLVATRGMGGMMSTIWLIVCAMCFGGTMAAAGMVGGITNSCIIGGYDTSLLQVLPGMAMFIPLIGGTGGNVGTQSSAIVVQGLANGSLNIRNAMRHLIKELGVALLNAVFISAVVFIYNCINPSDPDPWRAHVTTMAVSLSLFCVVIFASIFGTFVPMTLEKLKIDPAIATGPFISITDDIVGMLIYMSISSVLIETISRTMFG